MIVNVIFYPAFSFSSVNDMPALVFSGASVHRSTPVRDETFERFALVGRFVDTRATYGGSLWTAAVAYHKSYEEHTMHARTSTTASGVVVPASSNRGRRAR